MTLWGRLALCITCWSVTMQAAADAGKQPWSFLPIAARGLPLATASGLTGELEAAVVSAGEPVLLNDDAAERIQDYAAESVVIPVAALEHIKWVLAAEQDELALHPDAADRALEGLSLDERDAAAQDPRLAKQMEAICLTRLEYEVRRRAQEQAQKQAQLCRALFPALQPEAGTYPPGVLAELGHAPRSDVRVDAPAGCAVALNGKVVGVTPATFAVFAGPARLQLRCDGRSTRVHHVELGKRERIAIDPALDAALHTDRGLYLTTDDSVQLAKIGRWLGARVVPLYVQIVDGRIRVQLKAAPGAETERRALWYDLRSGYDERDLAAAVTELLHGGANPPQAPVEVAAEAPPRDASRSGGGVPTGAIILGGAGVAMLAGGLVTGLMGRARDSDVRRFAEQCTAPCNPPQEQRAQVQELQSEVETLYTTTTVLLVAGGVSFAAAVGWALLWPTAADSDQVSFTPFGVGARIAGRF